MTTKRAFLGSVLILTLILGGATILLLIVWSERSERSVLAPLPAVLLPPEAPATIMISCERGEEFGATSYPQGGVRPGRVTDLAPEPAIFARCRPNEDFTYDVQSTEAETMDSSRRPEIAFVLTEAGRVRDAFISRSSGSKSLDLKVLSMVVNRHYKATRCGPCRVFVAPPVNLKKYALSGPS
jgi:hypothetical protein